MVEAMAKVAGLALVRSLVGREQREPERGLAADGGEFEMHLVVGPGWPERRPHDSIWLLGVQDAWLYFIGEQLQPRPGPVSMRLDERFPNH
jgi:hypothetical protein